MGNFGKSAKGGPFAKLSILAIFMAQLRQARKSSILVRFEPNQYGWMRNLFQFLMIPKTLSNNKNQLRNRNISKGYSKWAILAKVQRGDPLQNSRFWPFSWPNFVRLENRQYQCELSLISMDGCGIYSSFLEFLVSLETRINSASIHTNQAQIALVLTIFQPNEVGP